MSHGDQLLAIIEREERRHSAAEARRQQLAHLRHPLRDGLLSADDTLERTRLLLVRLARWNRYFGREGSRRT